MKSVKLLLLSVAIVITVCGAVVCEEAAPKEWSFELGKVWEIDRLGEDQLLRPAEPRIADDGTLYFHDFERHLSYIIDGYGKLAGTFAPRGDKDGDVSFYINCFTAGDKVVVGAPDKLHFFTSRGQFIKAVPNNLFVSFPLAFKNENEFWVAPGALGDSPGGVAAVTHVNLVSGEETQIYEFTLSEEEKKPTGGGVVPGLTPQAKMAFDQQSGRAYFGKNSDSIISWFSGDDDEIKSFSFTGIRPPVSEEDKKNHMAGHDIPEEHLARMIEALPDQMAYYNRIEVIDNLVYLVSAESITKNPASLVVNVYSPEGRHLYYGRIQVEEGWRISGNADNLQLAQGFVYAILENEAGDKRIVKYTVSLPES